MLEPPEKKLNNRGEPACLRRGLRPLLCVFPSMWMINCDCTLDVPCQKPSSRPLLLFFPPKSFSVFFSLLHDGADMPQVHRHRQPPATNATEMTDSEEIWPPNGEQNKTFCFWGGGGTRKLMTLWKRAQDAQSGCLFIYVFIYLFGRESEKPPSLSVRNLSGRDSKISFMSGLKKGTVRS